MCKGRKTNASNSCKVSYRSRRKHSANRLAEASAAFSGYTRASPKLMQEHKWRFLARVIKRTEAKGVGLKQYLEAVKGLEAEAKESYSEDVTLKDNEFVEMLVLDGCFVVEMFRAFSGVTPFEKDDPFGSMQWIRFSLRDDFLCLENQIPFPVLEKLFTLTKMDGEKIPTLFLGGNPDCTLSLIALHFFNTSGAFARQPEVVKTFLGDRLKGQHLLDFLRKSYFPAGSGGERKPRSGSGDTHLNCFRRKGREEDLNIHCISMLRRAGIKMKCKKNQRMTFLPVEYKWGVIWMPRLELDDTMCAFLLNCVALEQCRQGGEKLVSEYAVFPDCLIDTHRDVDLLCEAGILVNHLATQREVAAFVAKLGKAAESNVNESYLKDVFGGVNKHYANKFYVHLAELWDTYFSSPWSIVSLLVALVLLLLTGAQTFYTIYPYYRPSTPKQDSTH